MATNINNPPLKHNSVADYEEIQEEEEEEEDYIDMEVMNSSSSSSPQMREFEFQKGPSNTSPADELFYRGKLLPLHLPPRLKLVQKLLQSTINEDEEEEKKKNQFCSMPFTPLESCNISPSESCRVSCDLSHEEEDGDNNCYFEWSTDLSNFINNNNNNHSKKSWSKKLKLVKQSLLIHQKLKASKAYLKGFFTKSGCSDESCAKAENGYGSNLESNQQDLMKVSMKPPLLAHIETEQQDLMNGNKKYVKLAMKPSLLGQIGKCRHQTIASVIKIGEKDGVEDNVTTHRRSFSAAIKRHSPTKCLSSSSSFSSSSGTSSSSSSSSSSIASVSNGCYELNFLKRSSSDTSEIEGSIQAAIAHCKKSQDLNIISSRKPMSENDICSLSVPKIVASN